MGLTCCFVLVLSLQATANAAFELMDEQPGATSGRLVEPLPPTRDAYDVPYSNPSINTFQPTQGQYASVAGSYAASLCAFLGASMPEMLAGTYNVSANFGQYYPEGSNPSMELLAQVYPDGVFDKETADHLSRILYSVGHDIDVKRDFGYGKNSARAASNGPLGGLPAFCRIGGFVQTSQVSQTFFEAWLPLASNQTIPLAEPNITDYPTNSTPFYIGPEGEMVQGPPSTQALDDWLLGPNGDDGSAADGLDSVDDDEDEDDVALSSSQSRIDDLRSLSKRGLAPAPKNASSLTGDTILGSGDGWNGRLWFVSNGAQRGFVPFPELKQSMSRYRFAVLGSNLGHFGSSTDVRWAAVDDKTREERTKDFLGGRSHATVLEIGRRLVDLYYGPTSGVRTGAGRDGRVRSYVSGCSVGGAQTLSTLLHYPDSFDGALSGCPAVNNTAMNYAQIRLQNGHRKSSAGSSYISNRLLGGPVRKSVLRQCDKLDKVVDGVITYPELCKPTFKDILCRSDTPLDNCLTKAQVRNLQKIYQPTILDGQPIYPGFLPGIEESSDVLEGSASKAIKWLLMAQKGEANVTKPERAEAYSGNLFTLDDIKRWQRDDVMGSDVSSTNLAPFFRAGGKLVHYAGLADLRISPLASRAYYERVRADNANAGIDIDQSYRYFEIAGMKHCRDGSGPWQIGATTQTDPGNRPLRYDAESDVILALIAWVEWGIAPQHLIGASYNARSGSVPASPNTGNDKLAQIEIRSYDYGVAFSRKICPYPLRPVAKGGVKATSAYTGPNAYEDFDCKHVDLPSAAFGIRSTSKPLLFAHVALALAAVLFVI